MTTTAEPIAPVWLNLDDLETVESCLQELISTRELEPEQEQHLAKLFKHFDWVRGEIAARQSPELGGK
jgi:hypothetical protein